MASALFVSCTNEAPTVADTSTPTSNITLEKLKIINDSIRDSKPCIVPGRARRRLRDYEYLFQYDLAGAGLGVGLGGLAGAAAGSLVPGLGTALGGLIGGLTGALHGGIHTSIAGFIIHENLEDFPSLDDVVTAYCMNPDLNVENGSYKDVYENILEIPENEYSIENIGKYHNLTLVTLMKKATNLNQANPLGGGEDLTNPSDDLIKNPGTLVQLSEFEKSVIFSDSFVNGTTEMLQCMRENADYLPPMNDKIKPIAELYMEAMGYFSYCGDYSQEIDLTNQYIALIDQSSEYTEEEKLGIYAVLSVGIYSYQFWSDYYEGN